MYQILISCREAATAALLLIPVYWILNKYIIRDKYRCLTFLIFSIYLATMYAAVGLPDITYYRYYPKFNFQPFLYMFSDIIPTVLNVVLFVPLGIFMPMLWTQFHSWWKTVGLGFALSLSIELLQIFTFRATDVNDLMTNTFGTLIGFITGRILLKLLPDIKPGSDIRNAALVYGTSFCVMFFLYPFLARILL